jgi:hypothetical protein
MQTCVESLDAEAVPVHDPLMSPAKKASKRELIEPHAGDKRYIRRDEKGRIVESDDVSRSLSQDVRKSAKKVVPKGQGDKGDQANPKKRS